MQLFYCFLPRCNTSDQDRKLVEPMNVGHTLEMRGCKATNPATRAVSGVDAGHFGGDYSTPFEVGRV